MASLATDSTNHLLGRFYAARAEKTVRQDLLTGPLLSPHPQRLAVTSRNYPAVLAGGGSMRCFESIRRN